MLIALTREVSPTIEQCELSYLPRVAIDADLARAQHRRYCQALADLGCRVVALAAEDGLPDAVFVEDTAIVLDEVAIIARPGVESRRRETESVASALRSYRPLMSIEPPGTLEGGDVLRIGRTLCVGLSGRTNASGLAQLSALTSRFGYAVRTVEVRGCLHLKTAVTRVAPDTLLVNPEWVDPGAFAPLSLVHVAPEEPYAANALHIGSTVIHPASFPRTRRRLEERGISVVPVDVSELQKAEAGVTCCSLVFAAPKEPVASDAAPFSNAR